MPRFVHALVFALVVVLGIASGAHALGSKTALMANFGSASDRVGALNAEALERRRQNPAAATTLASECSYAARGAANVADDVAVAASKLCFPAGTPILTPTDWVAIEEIAVGDEVYAFELDAFERLRGQGVDTSTLTEVRESRIGGGRGLATAGGRAGFRVEWDPRSGAHINAWAGKVKSGHFKFPGNAQSVQSLLRILYCR